MTDFSKAPEGATHYLDCFGCVSWYKVTPDNVFIYSGSCGVWSGSSHGESDLNKIPEQKYEHPQFGEVEVIAQWKGKSVFYAKQSKIFNACPPEMLKLSGVVTPEDEAMDQIGRFTIGEAGNKLLNLIKAGEVPHIKWKS